MLSEAHAGIEKSLYVRGATKWADFPYPHVKSKSSQAEDTQPLWRRQLRHPERVGDLKISRQVQVFVPAKRPGGGGNLYPGDGKTMRVDMTEQVTGWGAFLQGKGGWLSTEGCDPLPLPGVQNVDSRPCFSEKEPFCCQILDGDAITSYSTHHAISYFATTESQRACSRIWIRLTGQRADYSNW